MKPYDIYSCIMHIVEILHRKHVRFILSMHAEFEEIFGRVVKSCELSLGEVVNDLVPLT